jgi:hypothetical protein
MVGLAASAPAALAEAAGWSQQHDQQTRVQTMQAPASSAAAAPYVASLLARGR